MRPGVLDPACAHPDMGGRANPPLPWLLQHLAVVLVADRNRITGPVWRLLVKLPLKLPRPTSAGHARHFGRHPLKTSTFDAWMPPANIVIEVQCSSDSAKITRFFPEVLLRSDP